MKDPELLIVLDSSVLFHQHPMKSPKMKEVLYTMSLINAWLQVPAVILDEYINNYREQLLRCQDSLLKGFTEARRHGIRPGFPSERVLKRAVEKAVSDFSGQISREWGRRRVKFHPYPKVDHQLIVERCLDGRRPFRPRLTDEKNRDDKEKGYRDFLLWSTICEIYKATTSKIAFVTNDHEAFWDKDRKGLHSHLLEDLDGDPQGRVLLFESIDRFLAAYYYPNLERQKELEGRIFKGYRGNIDFESEIGEFIEDTLVDYYEEHACTVEALKLGPIHPKSVFLISQNKCCVRGECWVRFGVSSDGESPPTDSKPIRKRVKFEWDLHCDLELKKSTQRGGGYVEKDLKL
jgi:hypothetical protein